MFGKLLEEIANPQCIDVIPTGEMATVQVDELILGRSVLDVGDY
jgi:hypothetical protein